MNELLYRTLRFFKIYSLPFLTIVVAFGIYYAIFEVTHAHKVRETAHASDTERLVADDEHGVLQTPQVPIELPQPEAPLPEVPSAPNLAIDTHDQQRIDSIAITPNIGEIEIPVDNAPNTTDLAKATIQVNNPPQQESKKTEPKLYRVNTDVLNIRKLPSLNAAITGKKSRGENLEVSEIRGEWAKVSSGWAYLKLLVEIR